MRSIAITSPLAGATVKGTLGIKATASGVTTVDFFVDGQKKASDSAAPYSHQIDTTKLTNAKHTLQCVSGDGLVKSPIVTVTVANAPKLTAAFTAKEI